MIAGYFCVILEGFNLCVMKIKININLGFRWKLIFWLTLAVLLIFAATPRGYAQALDPSGAGTTSEQFGTTTTSSVLPAAVAPNSAEPAPTSNEEANSEILTYPYKKTFVVSSYYSPLPGQKRYFTGTYEGDVRLNGDGVIAADGSRVYPGIAAAPRIYPFGTKMEIPGFGIVAIHDRGGAIKGNRLDIWVGSGDEGLSRALGWGMRTVEVTVYGIDDSIKEAVNFSEVPVADLAQMLVRTKYFMSDLAIEDEGDHVAELQRLLKKSKYFNGEPSGYFGEETAKAVSKFQLDQKIIDSEQDSGAGNFGPRTRAAFEAFLEKQKQDAVLILPVPGLKKGDSGEPVKTLQDALTAYGFLKSASGVFDQDTYDALLRLQTDLGIISGKNEFGAGFYGPKTQQAVQKMIADSFVPSMSSAGQNTAASAEPRKVFGMELKLADKNAQVALLQEELNNLNFFRLEPTGYFGKTTEHAVFKFQQTFNIVESEEDQGAGVVGPKTREKLNELYASKTNQQRLIAKTTETQNLVMQRVADEKVLVAEIAGAFSADLDYGARGGDVEKLQKVLKKLGFFPGRLTTQYFGEITEKAILAFQKSHGVEESGILDLRTRRILNTIITPPQSS